jgi:hypothetical protein
MSARVAVLLALIVTAVGLLTMASPALARHPMSDPELAECDADYLGVVRLMEDGERWVCKYDPELDLYYWEPVAPTQTPGDAVAWGKQTWAAPDGITHVVMPRIEWINNVLYTGSDDFVRRPATTPLSEPAGWVEVASRVIAWDDATSAWNTCSETDWTPTTTASDHAVPTFNWGYAPCGARWYASQGFVEHWSPSAGTWLGVPAPVDTVESAGGENAGPFGSVWDAPPGDHTRRSKRPRRRPRMSAPPAPSSRPPVNASWAAQLTSHG